MLPALPLPAVPGALVAVLSTLALVVGGLVAGIVPPGRRERLIFSEYVEGRRSTRRSRSTTRTRAAPSIEVAHAERTPTVPAVRPAGPLSGTARAPRRLRPRRASTASRRSTRGRRRLESSTLQLDGADRARKSGWRRRLDRAGRASITGQSAGQRSGQHRRQHDQAQVDRSRGGHQHRRRVRPGRSVGRLRQRHGRRPGPRTRSTQPPMTPHRRCCPRRPARTRVAYLPGRRSR